MYANILVVDDTPANLRLLCSMLAGNGYEVRPVTDGRTALAAAQAVHPDLILLDITMPMMNGYEVCAHLKATPELATIPVIFISALNETHDKVRGFQVGGVDYISKPFQIEEVLARIETHLMLQQQRQEIEALRQQDRVYYEKLSRLKDETLRMASHDLKNPLSRVMMSVDLLAQQPEIQSERGLKYLESIRRGATQMKTLLSDLLDLAHLETGMALAQEKITLCAFLEQVVSDFSLAAQHKQLTLTLHVPSGDAEVWLDPARFQQVLHNLLSNAVKYTPPGGQVELWAETVANQLQIEVRDTGLGIPAEDIPYIFDQFYRVNQPEHRAEEGTGLGLSITHSIVEQHGGQIEVDSEVGRGTIFRIRLPLY